MTPITLLAAPFVGSFIGVIVLRLPKGRPVLAGRSVCDYCTHTLGTWDLVPVLSWVASRARCRHCGAPISLFYPLVELSALAVPCWAATVVSGWTLLVTAAFGWALLTLALIDARTQRLPDRLTLPLAAGGLVIAGAIDRNQFAGHLIGAVAGFLLFAAVAYVYRNVRGRDGLGHGDAKFLTALGAWVSWIGLPTIMLFAGASGLAYVLVRSLAGRPLRAHDRIALGPFLALGGWITWLYGPIAFK